MIEINRTISILILNGYPKQSRDNFDLSGVGHPHDFFLDFLHRYVPSAKITVRFAADPGDILTGSMNLNDLDAIIWTGSDLTIYHGDDERVSKQIAFAKAAYDHGVPSYGSCWGIQMAAVAAGGEVRKNPKGREWSIARNIRLTDAGKLSPFLEGKPERYNGFVMHLDEVARIPAGATILASNDHCDVQALEVKHEKGTFWAAQYHPEYNLLEMAKLIAARTVPLVNEGFFPDQQAAYRYANDMTALHENTHDAGLRAKLDIGEDIINEQLREQELRNWIDYLVIPHLRQ